MNLPTLSNIDPEGKKILVRGDLDVDFDGNGSVTDDTRLKALLPTLNFLKEKGASKVYILGHRGRPENEDVSLSNAPLAEYFTKNLNEEVSFLGKGSVHNEVSQRFVLLENLRFWPEEENEGEDLAQDFSSLGEVYINDAFAVSHRNHMSIVALPNKIKGKGGQVAAGLHFAKEVESLSRVLDNPIHPVILLLSGLKEDKLDNLNELKNKVDKVLIGGRLPEYIDEDYEDPKVIVAKLLPDKEDITIHSIEIFEHEIKAAGTIVLSGPPGKFEEEGHSLGTKRILDALSNSNAFKVAGGGDTIHALHTFNKMEAFNWVSLGGGAMLEFLGSGTLPGLQALLN